MRTALLLAALAGLVLVAMPAEAQQSASVVVSLETIDEILTPDHTRIIIQGVATFTGDATAYAALSGIPVRYTIPTQPEWVTASVSPANDVFPLPTTPSPMFQSSRPFTVVVDLVPDARGQKVSAFEVEAQTSASLGGRQASAIGMMPIRMDVAPDAPCDGAHVETAASEEAPALSVQQNTATPVATRWAVVGGFGLVGAAVGLLLRRRL